MPSNEANDINLLLLQLHLSHSSGVSLLPNFVLRL